MITRLIQRTALVVVAAFAFITITAPAMAQEVTGDWAGGLEVAPGTRLPLVLHIKRDDSGNLGGTLDSPAQGVQGMSIAGIKAEQGSLAFSVPSIGGSYQGQWDAALKSWKGEWSQAGMHWPLSFAVPTPRQLSADWQLPPDSEISKLLAERNAPRAGQGIVVGVLELDTQRIIAGGTGAGAKVNGTTLFEIGSITKVFTALLLADMVNKGEVSLDDPAAKYLPRGHRMPERGGRQITLRDLSTHRSGLPRMADDMRPVSDPDGPFADYTEDRLLAFLDRYQLTRDIGSQWEYSNLGVGLLGYVLAHAAGTDYETLLRKRITGPLGMNDTMITLPPDYAARLVAPFDAYMQPAKPWNLSTLMSAGGIRSSAADMLIFAKALLDTKSVLASAMNTALAVRVPGEAPQVDQALGWQVMHPAAGRELLLHAGETGGFRSILILEPAKGRAVVALANSAVEPAPVDLALHILIGSRVAPTPAVPPAPVKHAEISLSSADIDKFVGRYDFGNSVVIAVTRNAGNLYAQRDGITGAPVLPIYPEAPLDFFWKAVEAQIHFTTDASGAVIGAALMQGGQSLAGKRTKP